MRARERRLIRALAPAAPVVLCVAVAPLVRTLDAGAFWTKGRGTASAAAGTLSAPGQPVVTGASTLSVAWAAPASPAGAPVRYVVERRAEASATWTAVCGTDVATMTGRVCSDTPAKGTLRYRVRAVLGSWSATGTESNAAVVTGIVAGATSSASTGASGATSLTLTVPSSIAAGDLLLVQVAFGNGTDAGTDASMTPTGWTLAVRTNNTNSFGQAVLWKRATAGDAGTTVRVSFARSVRAAMGLASFAGVDATSPIVATGGATGSSSSLAAPSVNGTGGSLLLAFGALKRQGVAWGVPASMSTLHAFQNAQDASAIVATEELTAAGQTGTRTITGTPSGDWVAQAVVLRAA